MLLALKEEKANMDNNKVEVLLTELINLYKLVNKDKISEILMQELNEEKKIEIYKLSDGNLTTRDIGKKVGISHVTVHRYWKKWASEGIVYEADVSGRYIHSFDLANYALDSKE